MRNYCIIISVLILSICFGSCSKEEQSKTENPTALRPSVPVQVGEVRIGNQIWMTKNLNVSRYRNGDPIPQVTDPTQWANLTTGAWCYYNNDPANGAIYGKLYNWYAVNDSRGLAPEGWHIPTFDEWNVLTDFLGGLNVAGGYLKDAGTQYWQSPNAGGTNSSGFTGRPSGQRRSSGEFSNIGVVSPWWTYSENDIATSWIFVLNYNTEVVGIGYTFKNGGYGIRCLKD